MADLRNIGVEYCCSDTEVSLVLGNFNIFCLPLVDRAHEQLVLLFVSTHPVRAEWLTSERREKAVPSLLLSSFVNFLKN
jgi:hypothetical protein